MNRSLIRPAALVAVLFFAGASMALAGCSVSDSASSTFKGKNIIVSDVWARESAMSADAGAVYFKIENTSSMVDKLFSASVSQSFAKSSSIHETVMEGGASGSTMPGTGSSSMMSMKEVSSVTIPANGTVALEPGGYHVMLTGLTAPLKNGEKFEMNLGFLNGGIVKVTVTVKSS